MTGFGFFATVTAFRALGQENTPTQDPAGDAEGVHEGVGPLDLVFLGSHASHASHHSRRANLKPQMATAGSLLKVQGTTGWQDCVCRIHNGLNGPGDFRRLRKMVLPTAKTPISGKDMKKYSVSLGTYAG